MLSLKASSLMFWNWWVSELAELVPDSLKKRLYATPNQLLFLVSAEKKSLLLLKKNKRDPIIEPLEPQLTLNEISYQVKKLLNDKSNIKFGIVVDQSYCLIRHLEYPLSVKPRLKEIIEYDVKEKTPFNREDIYSSFTISHIDYKRKTIKAINTILRKDIISDYLHSFSEQEITLDFIAVHDAKKTTAHPNFNFIHTFKPNEARKKIFIFLYISILLSILCLITINYHKQNSAIETLEKKIDLLQKENKKQSAIQNSDLQYERTIGALYNIKNNHAPFIHILLELTQTLPDNVWLTDLRITKNKIYISGYADSAANLIGKLNNSDLFKSTKFASQVRYDQNLKKEQFSFITFSTNANFKN